MRHRRPDSALGRALDPDWYWRSADTMLLAGIADVVRWLQWAQTKDAHAKPPRNMPQPIKRPGVGPKKDPNVLLLSVDEVKRRLALPRRPLTAA